MEVLGERIGIVLGEEGSGFLGEVGKRDAIVVVGERFDIVVEVDARDVRGSGYLIISE